MGTAPGRDRREQLLDAVERCFERFGVEKTTLGDVAAECGVSRQTVYRYFRDRDALFNGVVLRTVERDWHGVGERFAHLPGLREWLQHTVSYALEAFPRQRSHALMQQLRAYDSGMAVALSDAGLAPAVRAMQRQYQAASAAGQLAPGATPERVAEWLYRLIYSYMLLPSPRLQTAAELEVWMREVALAGLFRA